MAVHSGAIPVTKPDRLHLVVVAIMIAVVLLAVLHLAAPALNNRLGIPVNAPTHLDMIPVRAVALEV